MSKFLVVRSLVSQPPSSVKPIESIWDRDSTSRGSASAQRRGGVSFYRMLQNAIGFGICLVCERGKSL